MAISLKCPGCGEPVVAQDSERGQSVKCGTCWTSVPVPTGTAPAAAVAKPATRTLTPVSAVVKPATASAKPIAAAVAKAIPVIAVPVVAMPVTAKPALKATSKASKEKLRFQDREDDEEEDDGDEAPKKKKGMGLLIGLGAAAVILVAGCGGLGWYLVGQSTTVASSTSTDGGGSAGKPNGWKQFAAGDGFAMDTPNGDAGTSDAKVNFGGESLDGRKYTQRDSGSTIQVAAIHCDLKSKALGRYTAGGLMLELFAMPNLAGSDRGKRFIGDREAAEFVVDRGNAHDHIWISKSGDRVYGFQFHWEGDPSGALDIKEAFFRSLAITHSGVETVDPNAPWNTGGTEPKGPLPIDTPWVAFPNNVGFTAEAPRGVKSEKIYSDRNQKKYHGRMYTTEDPQCFYHVLHHDVPVGDDTDFLTILKTQHQFSFAEKSTETGKIDGKAATKWVFKAGYWGHGYSVTVGFRVFTFIALSKTGFGNKPDPTLEDRADKFYKSIKIAFDPKKYDPFGDEPAWGPMAKAIGFTALAPKGTTVADHRVGFGKDEIKGTEYKSEQDALTFQVFAYDLPAGKTIDKVVSEQIRNHPIIDGPTAITLDGFAGEEVTVKDFSKFPIVLRSFKAGNRVFLAKLTRRYGNLSDMEYESNKARFFANFHIGAGAGGVVDPGDPALKPGVTGELVKAGKVLPFWAAAVLPEKKELITVSIRDGNGVKPAGVLRRYGYPDFKLKASYQLAVPMNRIAVDEKAGRLYLASVNVYDKTFVERELSFAQGDVQIFDLNKITDGTLADLADLKPLNTIPFGTRISAFEFSPKDKQLYVSAITQTKVGTKQVFRGRLYKLDTEKQKLGDPIELPEAAWSMRLAADGGKLYVCGMPIAPGPVPAYAIEVVDTATWKRSKTLTIPAAPVDVALARDRILTIATGKAEPELLGVNEVGDIAELTPRGEAMTGARYLRTTSDGKRVLISGGGVGNNTATYLDVVLDTPPRLTRIAGGNVIDSINLGGHFILSPDDKYAIFNSGIVIDLDKTAGK